MDVLRVFFLFAISVIAFSQYLRSSSSHEVKDIKDRLKSYEDQLKSMGDAVHRNAQNNEQFSELRRNLYSSKCEVPSDTIWYYVLFFYLSALIIFGSAEKFFSRWGIDSEHSLYVYKEEITGGYCFLGLAVCFLVFHSGIRAIKPKENARKISNELDVACRTLLGNRDIV